VPSFGISNHDGAINSIVRKEVQEKAVERSESKLDKFRIRANILQRHKRKFIDQVTNRGSEQKVKRIIERRALSFGYNEPQQHQSILELPVQ
jgi:hypothetical protein